MVMSELPDTPIFRFGATTHRNVPGKPDKLEENHVIVIPNIDFNKVTWHQVVGTWKNLNGTGNNGVLNLYFDGIKVGELEGFDHPLKWNIDDWEIRVGLGYRGKIDDFFILKSFLSAEAIAEIYHSGKSLGELLSIGK